MEKSIKKEKIKQTPWGEAIVILEEDVATGKVKTLVSKKRYKELIGGKKYER